MSEESESSGVEIGVGGTFVGVGEGGLVIGIDTGGGDDEEGSASEEPVPPE